MITPLHTRFQTFRSVVSQPSGYHASLFPSVSDSVRFLGGKPRGGYTPSPLLAKYGIDADRVAVVPEDTLGGIPKATILKRLLEVHEMAVQAHRDAKKTGNPEQVDKYCFGAAALLQDGTWGVGTNTKAGVDQTICAEQSSHVNARDNSLRRHPMADNRKVKLLLMTTSQELGEPVPVPCAQCQKWMSSSTHFSADTRIVTLRKTQNGAFELQITRLDEVLPLWGKQKPSQATVPIEHLKVRHSAYAKKSLRTKTILSQPASLLIRSANQAIKMATMLEEKLASRQAPHPAQTPWLSSRLKVKTALLGQWLHRTSEMPISDATMKALMAKAQQAYQSNTTADFSGKNTGAALLLSNGDMIPDSRTDWSSRFYVPADSSAAGHAFHRYAQSPEPVKIVAVAYYGDDPGLPPLDNLNAFAQPHKGSPDTLVLTADDDTLHVRTVQDYLGRMFIANSQQHLLSEEQKQTLQCNY